MPHFRIALGYQTEHRKSEPTVLATGFSKEALQAAVNAAPAKFLRFELGSFLFQQRAFRKGDAPGGAVEQATDGPTLEEGLVMLERIEKLEELLAAARAEKVDLSVFSVEELMIAIERKEGGLAAALASLPQNSTPTPIGEGASAPAGLASPTSTEGSQPSPAGGEQSPPAATEVDGPQLQPAPTGDKKRRGH